MKWTGHMECFHISLSSFLTSLPPFPPFTLFLNSVSCETFYDHVLLGTEGTGYLGMQSCAIQYKHVQLIYFDLQHTTLGVIRTMEYEGCIFNLHKNYCIIDAYI